MTTGQTSKHIRATTDASNSQTKYLATWRAKPAQHKASPKPRYLGEDLSQEGHLPDLMPKPIIK